MLALQPPPLNRLGQRPARQQAAFALPEVLLQVGLGAGGRAVQLAQLHGHDLGRGGQLGVLLGGDALALLGLFFAEDVDARFVQRVHPAAQVRLLHELAEVGVRDVAPGHAGRAAVAVGVHVPEAGFAGFALRLQRAREVELGGEVAKLEVRHDGCVTLPESVLLGLEAVGDALVRTIFFETYESALFVFEAEEAALFF